MTARAQTRVAAAVTLAAAWLATTSAPPARAAPVLERVRVGGLVDLTAKANRERTVTNIDNDGYSNYSALAIRLNFDFQVSEKTTVLTEIFAPGGFRFGLYGAYVRFRELAGSRVSLQAGKMPSAFGGYSNHAYGASRPLISYPLIYQYHTVVSSNVIPPSAGALLAWKEDRLSDPSFGQVTNEDGRVPLPPLYDRCWDTGIELFTSTERLEASLGVTVGTLSNPLTEDANSGKQVVGRLAFLAGPGWRIGVSGAYGPYLDECTVCYGAGAEGDSAEAGEPDVDEYGELSLGADLEWGMRHVELYVEGVAKRWESPWIAEHLWSTGYHTELKYTLIPGLYAAVAYGELLFGEVERSDGVMEKWDYPIRRIETGVGYFLNERTLLRATVQWNELYGVDDDDLEGALPAMQLEAAF